MKYLLKKIGYAFLTLFGVVSVIFFLFSVLPGDPAQMMLGQNQSEEQLEQMRTKYGFNESISKQYALYLNDLSPVSLHSTKPKSRFYFEEQTYSGKKIINFSNLCIVVKIPYLRESFQKNGKKVTNVIAETLPNTIILATTSILIAFVFGCFLGIVSSLKVESWLDQSVQVIATLGMSIPSFFSAVIFAWLFGYVLHEYTHLNMTGSLYALDDFGEKNTLQLNNLILPSIVLGIRPLAVISQLMRNAMLEVLSQDYIRTAKAKGLSKRQIVWNHAFKNSLNPVITAISGWFASLLAGAVFVEYIFGWNGLGKEIVDALNTLDLPVIMGAVLVIACMFISINILVDILYAYLDPKVKHSKH